ncbi:MAG TPA: hypothetical protein VK897_27145 [Anaerolineales bacterium]|nr:hypothetical protein [Anaerolineales bacterium]
MSTHLESKDLINAQQMEVSGHDPDGAMPLILGIGLANLSSSSHGTSTFLWLLNSPGVNLSEGLSQEPGRQFKFMKKIVLMILLLLNGRRSFFQ